MNLQNFVSMKRFVILLIVMLCCLPSDTIAQDRQQRKKERRALQGAIATIWYSGIYNGLYEFRWGDRNVPVPWAFARHKNISQSHPIAEEMNPDTGLIIARYKDGSYYNGQIMYKNLPSSGMMIYADGSSYSGMWMGFLPHGKGTYVAPNGMKFSVKSNNGIPHGKGIIQDSDGTLYKARWDRAMIKPKSIKPLKKMR